MKHQNSHEYKEFYSKMGSMDRKSQKTKLKDLFLE